MRLPAQVQVGRTDGWLFKTESGLQARYGKGSRKGAFSMSHQALGLGGAEG
jgi:hypothetical protein